MSGGNQSDNEGFEPALFVYGTLRPGRSNWPVVASFCARHEAARLPGFGLYALDHPCAVAIDPDEHATEPPPSVSGDLLWLVADRADDAIARLDAFEGVDATDPARSYYRRIEADVVTLGSARHRAWVYLPGDDLLRQVDPARRVAADDWPA